MSYGQDRSRPRPFEADMSGLGFQMGRPELHAMFRRPGVTYRLLLRRDGTMEEVALTTRRLI